MAWIYEDTGQPYNGRVINIGGEYYTTTHGTLEGDSRPVLPINNNGTRTVPFPNQVNQYGSETSTPSGMRTSRNNINNRYPRNRNQMNRASGMRRGTSSGRVNNMGRSRGMNLRPRPPVMTDCPPGLLTCPDGSCVEDLNNCPYVEPGPGQNTMPVGCPNGYFRCWDGTCAPTLNQCPINPNFNPGAGETLPGNQLQMPRVPGQNIGQCYCECARIGQPLNISFNGMLGSCSHAGQHCDNQCIEYCNSQVVPDWYTDGGPDYQPGMPAMQFSWSHCYDVTP